MQIKLSPFKRLTPEMLPGQPDIRPRMSVSLIEHLAEAIRQCRRVEVRCTEVSMIESRLRVVLAEIEREMAVTLEEAGRVRMTCVGCGEVVGVEVRLLRGLDRDGLAVYSLCDDCLRSGWSSPRAVRGQKVGEVEA